MKLNKNIFMKIKNKQGYCYWQWIFSLLASTTLLVYGLDCGWISPMTKYLQSESSPTGYPLSSDQLAWIASSPSVAAMFVVLVYAQIADRYGRKNGVIVIAVLEAIAWIIRISFNSFISIIVSKFFGGLAAAGCYSIIPMYIKEISQDDMRGILGTFPTLLQTSGILTMYIIGAYLNYTTVNIIVMTVSIMAILVMIKAPESPEFLVKQDKIAEATKTVAFLRGLKKDDTEVLAVVEQMKKEEDHFKSLPDITLLGILKNKTWRRGLIYIMISFTCFEVNGAFAIVTYASTILTSTGVKFHISPEIESLSFPVVMIIGSLTLVTCVERCGRKPLLIGAFLISSCCMFGIAVIIFVENKIGNVPSLLPVVAMMFIVAMYSGGVCPLTYIIMTEMFNFRIRAKVMGIVVSYGWFLTFFMLRTHTLIANSLGVLAPFIFYGIMNLTGALFTLFCLAETKGKTEEEILQALMKKKTINEN